MTTHQATNRQLSHRHNRAFRPEKLSQPRQFERPVLSAEQSLVIEIGAGKGMHALRYAKAHPNAHVIAIERTRTKFAAFTKAAQSPQKHEPAALSTSHSPHNLTLVHADAIAWIVHALPPASVDRVYLLYPNPEQHNPNQQWLNMPFFEFLLSRLREGGEIILASNIEDYITHAVSQAEHVWQLPVTRRLIPSSSRRTHFEIKYLARGESCWEITLTKPIGYQTRFDQWQFKQANK